jgi:hypothetical protein
MLRPSWKIKIEWGRLPRACPRVFSPPQTVVAVDFSASERIIPRRVSSRRIAVAPSYGPAGPCAPSHHRIASNNPADPICFRSNVCETRTEKSRVIPFNPLDKVKFLDNVLATFFLYFISFHINKISHK